MTSRTLHKMLGTEKKDIRSVERWTIPSGGHIYYLVEDADTTTWVHHLVWISSNGKRAWLLACFGNEGDIDHVFVRLSPCGRFISWIDGSVAGPLTHPLLHTVDLRAEPATGEEPDILEQQLTCPAIGHGDTQRFDSDGYTTASHFLTKIAGLQLDGAVTHVLSVQAWSDAGLYKIYAVDSAYSLADPVAQPLTRTRLLFVTQEMDRCDPYYLSVRLEPPNRCFITLRGNETECNEETILRGDGAARIPRPDLTFLVDWTTMETLRPFRAPAESNAPNTGAPDIHYLYENRMPFDNQDGTLDLVVGINEGSAIVRRAVLF